MFLPGDIIANVGPLGSGKSMNMSRFIARYMQAGVPAYANYALLGARRFSNLAELTEVRNSIIGFDEVGLNFDSRAFKDKEQIEFSHWLYLVRKRGNILFYSIQSFTAGELRLRELTTYIFFCSRVNRNYSNIKFAVFDAGSGAAYIRSQSIMKHSKYYSLYDTYDEDVFISSSGKKSDLSKTAVSSAISNTLPSSSSSSMSGAIVDDDDVLSSPRGPVSASPSRYRRNR